MKISESDLRKLTLVMEEKNLTIEEVIKFIAHAPTYDKKVVDTSDKIILNIDYTKTVEQAIADGDYDYKNSDINAKNFPVSPEMIGKKADVSAKLFHFNRNISSEDVISEMDNAGYRSATLMELLTLGILFPELQRQFPIIALGSVWLFANDNRCATCLDVHGSKRRLNLGWFDLDWYAHGRFLGVRK